LHRVKSILKSVSTKKYHIPADYGYKLIPDKREFYFERFKNDSTRFSGIFNNQQIQFSTSITPKIRPIFWPPQLNSLCLPDKNMSLALWQNGYNPQKPDSLLSWRRASTKTTITLFSLAFYRFFAAAY
jgi:hypothetical protein